MNENGNKTTTILLHTIEYWYRDYDGELDEVDEQVISDYIADGCHSGELCTTDPKNPDVVHYGWWRIA